MWGGVGRGKSFLMDCFFQAVPLTRKTRLHFHEFMREVHRELQELKGTADPLQVLGERIARRFRLICFDEFHVADVTDAMILHRLLEAMFAHRVSIVTTSQLPARRPVPQRPAPRPHPAGHRAAEAAAGGGQCRRRHRLPPAHAAADADLPLPAGRGRRRGAWPGAFDATGRGARRGRRCCTSNTAKLRALRRAGGVVWFDFRTLCGGPRSQNDYLEIASRFHTVLLSDVPQMPPRLASEARRFTWLVDVLYDRRVKLILSAEVAAGAALHRRPAGARVPAHRLAAAARCSRPTSWRRRGARSTPR